eukprot:4841155-Alexandrium_andersonii.AAC.1
MYACEVPASARRVPTESRGLFVIALNTPLLNPYRILAGSLCNGYGSPIEFALRPIGILVRHQR